MEEEEEWGKRVEKGWEKRADPDLNYGGSIPDFMRGEIARLDREDMLVDLDIENDGDATSLDLPFRDIVQEFGLTGLYGCTAVVAVSTKGAWISHYWEIPGFLMYEKKQDGKFGPKSKEDQDEEFDKYVIQQMLKGADTVRHENGLTELKADGTFSDGPETDTRIFMIVPRKRADGDDVPDSVSQPEDANKNAGLAFEDRVRDMETEIRKVLGERIKISRIEYSPMVATQGERRAIAQASGEERQDMKDVLDERLADERYDTHRGKLIVQYQPASDCQQNNEWRVWFESRAMTEDRRHAWTPKPISPTSQDENPRVKSPDPGVNDKREEPSAKPPTCPLNRAMSTSSSTSATSTSISTSTSTSSTTTSPAAPASTTTAVPPPPPPPPPPPVPTPEAPKWHDPRVKVCQGASLPTRKHKRINGDILPKPDPPADGPRPKAGALFGFLKESGHFKIPEFCNNVAFTPGAKARKAYGASGFTREVVNGELFEDPNRYVAFSWVHDPNLCLEGEKVDLTSDDFYHSLKKACAVALAEAIDKCKFNLMCSQFDGEAGKTDSTWLPSRPPERGSESPGPLDQVYGRSCIPVLMVESRVEG